MSHEATIAGVGVAVEEAGAPVVLLRARDELVPIFVGGGQARSIERALAGVPAERPMTHDLFADVLETADVAIDRVRIDDLANETFHAKLDLAIERGGDPERAVRDARPSDALALAARVGCDIRIADDVIDEAGRAPGSFGIVDSEGEGSPRGGPTNVDVRGGAGGEDVRSEGASLDPDDAVDIEFDDGNEESGVDDADGDDDRDD